MSFEVNMLSGAMAFMFASCKGPEATLPLACLRERRKKGALGRMHSRNNIIDQPASPDSPPEMLKTIKSYKIK